MKGKKAILGVVVLLVTLILVAKYASEKRTAATTPEPPLDLASAFSTLKDSGKPSIVVFSYDADCCETTKAYFNEYNSKAKTFLERQKSKSNTLFVNTGVLDEDQVSEFLKIANDMGITEIPCILFLDAGGKPVQTIQGPFDTTAVTKAAEGLVR